VYMADCWHNLVLWNCCGLSCSKLLWPARANALWLAAWLVGISALYSC
jgi:hypothetical protein